ncbi:family 78 glycoside hydrolase catalytic domain [Aerococcaceae bacterium zg-B36]|uniref:family 78 glycoside hydrolase catalytic domain n=1 Tax=Aerococcaceae bacterium zg-252 TaxID=2796928 RepID=UPI001BD8F459|nr:family 78 glycoside hydrolase catalytic domain [Aerococcaceae bacterium zg-B36]
MKGIRLKTNHMINPIGIDADSIFFSWNCEEDSFQTAWQIQIFIKDELFWDSGKVDSSDMSYLYQEYLPHKTVFAWKIRLWNEELKVGEWSHFSFFETGLDTQNLTIQWINPEIDKLNIENYSLEDSINRYTFLNWKKKAEESENNTVQPFPQQTITGDFQVHQPASYLKKSFTVEQLGDSRLYITSKGLYVVWINGERIEDMVLAPGTTSFDYHVSIQTYDISSYLKEGDNQLLIALGDGWYRSTSGVSGDRNIFGEDIGVWFRVETNGEVICEANQDIQASQNGPIRQNDMQHGEIYDARLSKIEAWHEVKVENNYLKLKGMNTVPIIENERFVGKIFTTPNGDKVIDFGQNIAGYPEIEIDAKEGQVIRLVCGEALDENGNFTQENFQERDRHKEGGILQIIELICKNGYNYYKPSFTIMGFQYAKIETDVDLTNATFTAVAVYSKMETLGHFESSNVQLNQLVQNSIWSMKGNFCDIPTDCPTRERAGWTGDIGLFIETGLYLMDCLPIVRKWLLECQVNQYEDGKVANISPKNSFGSYITELLCMSVGWGDSVIITPYEMYKRTGDISLLKENYAMMQKWYAFLYGRAQMTTDEQLDGEFAKYTVLNGMDYGEWSEPGITAQQAMMNPRKSIGTAYLAYSGRLMAEIAGVLGRNEEADKYMLISENAKKAYRYAFTNNGIIKSDRQHEYVRAIQFNLLPEDKLQEAANELNKMIIENNYHLNTGFLSTPHLCSALTKYGYYDTAYKLLLQDTYPSWLYAINKGANTIWETWDGINQNGKPQESLNHYAYGAISGWLFKGVCGINISGNEIVIQPNPNKLLEMAKASYASPVGLVKSGWQFENEKLIFDIEIPVNNKARFILPNGKSEVLNPGVHKITMKWSEIDDKTILL